MPVLFVVAVLAFVVACAAVYRLHQVRRALVVERASRRIEGRIQAQDLDAFRERVNELLQERAVLAEAEHVLDSAIASHYPEGGSQ